MNCVKCLRYNFGTKLKKKINKQQQQKKVPWIKIFYVLNIINSVGTNLIMFISFSCKYIKGAKTSICMLKNVNIKVRFTFLLFISIIIAA